VKLKTHESTDQTDSVPRNSRCFLVADNTSEKCNQGKIGHNIEQFERLSDDQKEDHSNMDPNKVSHTKQDSQHERFFRQQLKPIRLLLYLPMPLQALRPMLMELRPTSTMLVVEAN
jgi:hypothetical protein